MNTKLIFAALALALSLTACKNKEAAAPEAAPAEAPPAAEAAAPAETPPAAEAPAEGAAAPAPAEGASASGEAAQEQPPKQ